MKRIIVVAKKELHRFFRDWRMIIITLVFPGAMLFFLYAIVVPNVFLLLNKAESQTIFYTVNPSETVRTIFYSLGIELTDTLEHEEESIKNNIAEKSNELLIIFPPDFDIQIAEYNIHSNRAAPEISIYYNSLTNGIIEQYGKLVMILNEWETSLVNKFDINKISGGDLAKDQDKTGFLLSIMLPVFILLFIFYGAMAIVIGTITGEKEKGTLSAVLIVPMSTRELAGGKVFALGFETFLCGISGFLGILFSLPRLVGSLNDALPFMQTAGSEFIVNISYYSINDYLSVLLILLSTAYFIVILVSIVSVFARTVREAQMLLTPVILAVVTISLLGAVYGSDGINDWYYCIIPFYNTIILLNGIFSLHYSFLYVIITVLSNIFFTVVGIELFSRLLKNEKIMFPQ